MFLRVSIKISKKSSEIIYFDGVLMKININVKPEKNEANKEIIKILANFFKTKKVFLLKGFKSRNKLFKIEN